MCGDMASIHEYGTASRESTGIRLFGCLRDVRLYLIPVIHRSLSALVRIR